MLNSAIEKFAFVQQLPLPKPYDKAEVAHDLPRPHNMLVSLGCTVGFGCDVWVCG